MKKYKSVFKEALTSNQIMWSLLNARDEYEDGKISSKKFLNKVQKITKGQINYIGYKRIGNALANNNADELCDTIYEVRMTDYE